MTTIFFFLTKKYDYKLELLRNRKLINHMGEVCVQKGERRVHKVNLFEKIK
jgi:hypothetical protein